MPFFISSAFAKDSPSDALFQTDKVWTIHLKFTAEEWAAMQPVSQPPSGPFGRVLARLTGQSVPTTGPATRPIHSSVFNQNFPVARCTVGFAGETWPDVAVRYKGNASYNTSIRGMKHPFKLDFNDFVENRKFHGVDKLDLNNNSLDATELRESMSYAVYRDAGLPAPRTAFAKVYLTVPGKYEYAYLGLYTLIENIDKGFLKRHFASNKGLLLKPERALGLPYYGEDWKNYVNIYRPKTEATPETSARLIGFVRLVNQADDAAFRKQIDSYLDVDSFLRYIAATVLLSNLDSPLTTGHNYYLYVDPADKKVHWLPWDMHLSYAGFAMVGSGEQQMNLSISHPWNTRNRLIERVMAIPEYNRAYRAHLARMMETCFKPETLVPRIARAEDAIREAMQAEQKTRSTTNPYPMPPPSFFPPGPALQEFVPKRVASVQAQLAGKTEGYIPIFQFRPARTTQPTTRPVR